MTGNNKAGGTVPTSADAEEADRLCSLGYAFLEDRRFDDAHATLARARTLAPENPLIHYRLGLLFNDTGRPGDALMCFDAAIRLHPDDVRAHNNRGSALQVLGKVSEAESAFRHAISLAPDADIPYLNLGQLLAKDGRKSDAVEVFRQAIGRGLNRPLFEHHLAAMAGEATARAPDDWVVATFDNFAPTFDAHLRGLSYQVPRLLASALQARGKGPWDILDLGCGTGQCGVALASLKRRLVGVDLSPRMLAQARALGAYDDLATAEVHAWLRSAEAASFDVVCAADVLIYIGALEALFRDVHRVLRGGGWFAFSTEECQDRDYQLRPSGRYAQSQAYIRALAETSFKVETALPVVIRVESGAPVPGRIYVLQKR